MMNDELDETNKQIDKLISALEDSRDPEAGEGVLIFLVKHGLHDDSTRRVDIELVSIGRGQATFLIEKHRSIQLAFLTALDRAVNISIRTISEDKSINILHRMGAIGKLVSDSTKAPIFHAEKETSNLKDDNPQP